MYETCKPEVNEIILRHLMQKYSDVNLDVFDFLHSKLVSQYVTYHPFIEEMANHRKFVSQFGKIDYSLIDMFTKRELENMQSENVMLI